MNDLETLRPEVRDALEKLEYFLTGTHNHNDFYALRAELLRLAGIEAHFELHAPPTPAEWHAANERAEKAEAELAALKARTIVSLEMVHEAEAHVPCALHGPERWEWLANFFNRALTHPGVPCPCCGVAPNGEIYDHLTPEQWREMQPKEES